VQVAALEPGPEAIALLAGLAGRVMSEAQALQVVALWQPQLAWVAGAEQAALLRAAGPTPDPGDRKAVLEDEFTATGVAPVLNASIPHAQQRVDQARALSERFVDLGEALRSGGLDGYRVRVITEVLVTLRPAHAARVEQDIVPVAATLSPARLRRRLHALARAVDPDWNTAMFTRARKGRRVTVTAEGQDGLVGLHAYLPPVEAIAVHQHLQHAAQTGPVGEGDRRDHDERMADAFTAAVLGSTPGDPTSPLTPNVTVNVFVPLPLLLGLRTALDTDPGSGSEGVAELDGYGALPVGLVRALAGDASWRRWVLEEVTGHLLDLGKHRYTPNRELDEYTRARDRYCRYPGCDQPATNGDLDHLEPFTHDRPPDDDDAPGGATSAANLAGQCRRHHRGKTFGYLTVTGEANGTLTWTDPNGHTNTTEPHNYNQGL